MAPSESGIQNVTNARMLPSVSTWAKADQRKILPKRVRGRSRMGAASVHRQRQEVADVAHGLDAALEIALRVELAAYFAHERVDVAVDAGGCLARESGGGELVACHDLAGVAQQVLQQVELGGREVERAAGAADAARGSVQVQVAHHEVEARAAAHATAQHRADTRHELAGIEG